MGTNTLAGTGLVFSRNLISAAPTFQANQRTIKNGYATKIGLGDLVKTGSGGGANQGYIELALQGDTAMLGVFAGGLQYYDSNLQTIVTIPWWTGTATMPAGVDAQCLVVSDPFAVFRVQMSGGPFTQSMVGRNINFTAATNGAPNIAGISVLTVDATTISDDPALPLRIEGVVGFAGGPSDPTFTNPWIEVRLNSAEMLRGAGV